MLAHFAKHSSDAEAKQCGLTLRQLDRPMRLLSGGRDSFAAQ